MTKSRIYSIFAKLKLLIMRTVKAIIERAKDGCYSIYMDCKDYKFGLYGYGNTVEEAINDFYDCYNDIKDINICEVPELKFEFNYDTASFLQYFGKKLSLTGLQTITGINRKQLNHYVTGHSKPSARTVKRIQDGLNKFQKELSLVKLI